MPKRIEEAKTQWVSMNIGDILFYLGYCQIKYAPSASTGAPTVPYVYEPYKLRQYNSTIFCFFSPIRGSLGFVKVFEGYALGTVLEELKE